jgi:hypothetical protein
MFLQVLYHSLLRKRLICILMHVLWSTVLTSIYVSNVFKFYFVSICCCKYSLFTNVFYIYIYITKRKNNFFIWASRLFKEMMKL